MRQKVMFRTRVESWLAAWADLACSILSILTLAYYRPWWDFELRIYFLRKQVDRQKRRKINEKRSKN